MRSATTAPRQKPTAITAAMAASHTVRRTRPALQRMAAHTVMQSKPLVTVMPVIQHASVSHCACTDLVFSRSGCCAAMTASKSSAATPAPLNAKDSGSAANTVWLKQNCDSSNPASRARREKPAKQKARQHNQPAKPEKSGETMRVAALRTAPGETIPVAAATKSKARTGALTNSANAG